MTSLVRFLFVLFFAVASVNAEDAKLTAKQILANMINAMSALNYEGTVVLLRNGKLETMKYYHAVDEGRQQERLVSLNSPLREIIRNGDLVSCRYNDTQDVVFERRPHENSFLVNFSKSLDELADFYDFVIVGEEDVAMFPAFVIEARPKDHLRYARRIWVEKLQYLPLKITIYDLSGALLEQVVFTEQHVKAVLPFSDGPQNTDGSNNKSVDLTISNDDAALPFTVAQLPAGFKEIYFTRRTMHNSRLPVDYLRMSDGLASVSVYMENKNPGLVPGLRSVGAVSYYSRDLDGFQVTAMGEVPPTTVKTIAEGIGIKSPAIQ